MTTRKWQTIHKIKNQSIRQAQDRKSKIKNGDIVKILLNNRGLNNKKEIEEFLNPQDPYTLTAKEVEIDKTSLTKAINRIKRAIQDKESMVVYTDYDADGITAGAIMWQTLYKLGARVMPYIPHRVEEGYGLSIKGIDNVKKQYNPTLIITVDHGITAWEKVQYAKKHGIEVIVTDHHVKPDILPDCILVYTTQLAGAGVSWFVAKELLSSYQFSDKSFEQEILATSAIGTIADMVPLVKSNRALAKWGLSDLNKTDSIGLEALIKDAGLVKGKLNTYEVSHMIAPRLNAMGRIVHAIDALRLLCTHQKDKARLLAQKLGFTNRERQQLTLDTSVHAKDLVHLSRKADGEKKLLFVSHEEYNQGVIGLVAGKLVEEFYRPAIVIAKGEQISRASARSIPGFNIIEAIRNCSDLLIDAGGHPMAAGFTIETKKLDSIRKRLEKLAEKELTQDKLERLLKIDTEIELAWVTEELWNQIQEFQPFGMSNTEPVFATRGVEVVDTRLVGADGRHLKIKFKVQSFDSAQDKSSKFKVEAIEGIAFGMGELYGKLNPNQPIDIAYTIAMDTWNGNKRLQLKVKDIQFH